MGLTDVGVYGWGRRAGARHLLPRGHKPKFAGLRDNYRQDACRTTVDCRIVRLNPARLTMKPTSMKHLLQSPSAAPSSGCPCPVVFAVPSASVPKRSRARQWAQGLVVGTALVLVASSCASLNVKRDTETSGTFNSSGRAFTFFGYVFPRQAIQIAHENVADAGLPNCHATSVSETDWGWLDWVLEIISFRSARVKGTWGFNGETLGLDTSGLDSEHGNQ